MRKGDKGNNARGKKEEEKNAFGRMNSEEEDEKTKRRFGVEKLRNTMFILIDGTGPRGRGGVGGGGGGGGWGGGWCVGV